MLFDTQIVVTGRLRPNTHSSLRILSKKATQEDVRNFILNVKQLTEPGAKNNADAVLQISISANEHLYAEIRRESDMCKVIPKFG